MVGSAVVDSPSHPSQVAAWVVHLVEPLPGDANFDDRVDLNDFGILKAHLGSGHWRDQGDFDRDFAVDLTDFGILKGNFGRSAAAVPEPTGLALLLVGMLTLSVFVRNQRSRIAPNDR